MCCSADDCVCLRRADRFKRPAAERGAAQHQRRVDYEEVSSLSPPSRLLLMASHPCCCSVLQGWIHSSFLCRADCRKARGRRHSVQELMTATSCPLKCFFLFFFCLRNKQELLNTSSSWFHPPYFVCNVEASGSKRIASTHLHHWYSV